MSATSALTLGVDVNHTTNELNKADDALRGEFRRDRSNEDFFPAPTSDTPRAHQNMVLVGLVWWIGNKQGAW